MGDYLAVDLSRSNSENKSYFNMVEFRNGEFVQLHTYNNGLLSGQEMASAINWECHRLGIDKVVLDATGLGLLLKDCLLEFSWLNIVEIDRIRAMYNIGSIYDELMDIKNLGVELSLKRNLQNHMNFKLLLQQINNLEIKQTMSLKLSLSPKDHEIDMGLFWCIANGIMCQMGFVK